MADIMLQLGSYQFSINTAAYREFQRSAEYRWKNQERIGQTDALQYTGSSQSISLSGIVFPEWKGGVGQINSMREEAAKGTPLLLVDGQGLIHGRWVIQRIEESQGVFGRFGIPKRQQFSVQLRHYDDGPDIQVA